MTKEHFFSYIMAITSYIQRDDNEGNCVLDQQA
jgi:hypothetical protein